jgi:hypothetical protein
VSGSGVSSPSLSNRNVEASGSSSSLLIPSMGPHLLRSVLSSSKIRSPYLIGAGLVILLLGRCISASKHL